MSQTLLSAFFPPDTSPRAEEMRRRMAEVEEQERRRLELAARAAEERELAEIAEEQERLAAAKERRAAAAREKALAQHEKRAADLRNRRLGHAEVAPGVYLGNEYASNDAHFFEAAAVSAVVNCTRDLPCVFEESGVRRAPGVRGAVEYMRVPVDDSASEHIGKHFANACEFVARALAAGGAVLVHCREGKSRSAAVCAAYLVKCANATLREALDRLNKDAWTTAINDGFMHELMDWEVALHPELGGVSTMATDHAVRESKPDADELCAGLTEQRQREKEKEEEEKRKKKRVLREPTQPETVDGKVYAIFSTVKSQTQAQEAAQEEPKPETKPEAEPKTEPKTETKTETKAPEAKEPTGEPPAKRRRAAAAGSKKGGVPPGQQSIAQFFVLQ